MDVKILDCPVFFFLQVENVNNYLRLVGFFCKIRQMKDCKIKDIVIILTQRRGKKRNLETKYKSDSDLISDFNG